MFVTLLLTGASKHQPKGKIFKIVDDETIEKVKELLKLYISCLR